MKERNDLLLNLRLEVNEQIAATDKVHLGEGRVCDQVLRGEHDGFP
jgi:hypothetical protein